MNQPLAPTAPIAFIEAGWHADIVARAHDGFADELARLGGSAPPPAVQRFAVPGAFEIPLLAKKLAQSGRFDAVIATALIVNGGIYRHEFVASAVIDALMRVQLDTDVPVFSAVLTPRDFHEHGDHVEFFRAHFVKKGVEVAHACLATLQQHARLASLATAAKVA